jgi:ABC-2 type transport system ATP-binding protein
MDEPTSGLDPVFRSELLEILQNEMQDENRGILLSSHITSDLERIADYICFINHGQVVCADVLDNIMEKYLVIKGPRNLLNESSRQLLLGVKENDFGFEALSDKPFEAQRLFRDQALYERPSLDQIILFTVRGDKNDAIN